MAARDTGAEQAIKDAAKRKFFSEGKLHATTQDIANDAGVNRTLLNYYFRTREALFEEVFNEAMQEFGQKMDAVLLSDLPFREKVENFIETFLAETMTYPYREIFLITEINREDFDKKHKGRGDNPVFLKFFEEIQQALDQGILRSSTSPLHVMINMFSLMAYPVVIQPLYQSIFGLDQEAYRQVLGQRKQEILNMLFQ